jgi:hypothetical protein
MNGKIDGQLWIGQEQPNVLKYQAAGNEYWAVSATTYLAATTIKKGQLVAISKASSVSTAASVTAATWPTDADGVIGMALDSASPNERVHVLNYGYVTFDESELSDCFVTSSDLYVTEGNSSYYSAFGSSADGGGGNDWGDTLNGVSTGGGHGQPVYWFIGRTIKTAASTYSWQDPATYPGELTFSTPSGYKIDTSTAPYGDDSLNCTYKHLPKVGSVVSYTYNSTTGKLTSLQLHINFTTFHRQLQVEYPATGLHAYTATSTADPETITLRHGLFPTGVTPHVALRVWGYSDSAVDTATSAEACEMHAGSDSYLTTDRRTEVELASDTTFYYKLAAEVNYDF